MLICRKKLWHCKEFFKYEHKYVFVISKTYMHNFETVEKYLTKSTSMLSFQKDIPSKSKKY